MMDPRVLLIAAILAGVFYVGDEVVAVVKKVDLAIVHAVKSAEQKIVHVFHHPKNEGEQP